METADPWEIMITEPIRDVLVSGYIDSEEPPCFNALYKRVYFMFDHTKIEMYIDDKAKICFRAIENINQWFDLDDDDRFSLMSIYLLVFKTEQAVCIKSLSCDEPLLSELTINYVDDGMERKVMFDPRNFFGFSFNH